MMPQPLVERGWLAGCVLAMALLLALPLRGEELADAIAGLAEPDPKPAIQALIQIDDAKARAALQAAAAGTLFRRLTDGAVVIGEKDGELYAVTNAATGDVEDMAKAVEL